MKFENLQKLSWTPVGKFVFWFHIVTLVGLPIYFYNIVPSWKMVLAMFVFFCLTGLGITMGYHRLYAHRAYNLNKVAEFFVLFFGTMAIQGPVLKWSYDHRLHHSHTDKPGDPYNVIKGFWYAHILWMFDKLRPIDDKIVPDLRRNKLVMFQYRHYVPLVIFTNASVCLAVGWLLGDYISAFVMVWVVRLMLTYHMTWFINSLAHYWGERSYSKELSARDNAILALLTFGEGYHNYHHTFPADYRNGVGIFHFDPAKWFIWTFSKLGLATELRRFNKDNVIDKLIYIDKRLLLKRVSEISYNKGQLKKILVRRAITTRASLESHIESLAISLNSKRGEVKKLLAEYRALRRLKVEKSRRHAIKLKIRASRKAYAREWKNWCELCSAILNSKKGIMT